MTKISAKLRAAILSGAVGLLPSIAFAESGSRGGETTVVPDHAAAEARSVGDSSTSGIESRSSVPDHAAAEARGQGDIRPPSDGTAAAVPDHATVERRGAEAE